MRSPAFVPDDHAASPVIGIILMVMVTVTLAAVVGSFALGLASFVDTGAPAAEIHFEYDPAGDGNLTITHDSGETIPEEQVEFVVDGDARSTAACADGRWAAGGESITAGDVCRLEDVAADAVVKVVWFDRNSSGYVAEWSG